MTEIGDTIEYRKAPIEREVEYRLTRDNHFVRCIAGAGLEHAFISNAWLFTVFLNRMAAAL